MKIEIVRPTVVACEVSVKNVSENYPTGIVTVQFNGPVQVEFRFPLRPNESRNDRMEKPIAANAGSISGVDIDEE